MNKDKKQKKIQWQQYIGMVFLMLIGAACGFLMAKYTDVISYIGSNPRDHLLLIVLLLVILYGAIFLQIIIHETGHLISGLLTGYHYSSFRIGSFVWIKENGKLCFRKLSLAGTGGQCLMVPPKMVDGKIPFVLYNLGGSLLNIISGLVFLGLYLIFKDAFLLSIMLLIIAAIGFAFGLMNGIPMQFGTVNNDGYNIVSLRKDNDALHSFWVQMKLNEQSAGGIRLKDMPEEWFNIPSPEGMQNSITAVIGVFACNRLMDAHKFEEADQLMDKLLQMDTAMVGLHRSLLICDRIYCELIGMNRQVKLAEMLDKQQKKFMKSMKKFPSVLRTEYVYMLLSEKNTEKACKIKDQFEKCAHTYPYPAEIESERQLMEWHSAHSSL